MYLYLNLNLTFTTALNHWLLLRLLSLQYRYFTTPALTCLSSLNANNLVDGAHSKLFGLMADGIPMFGPLGKPCLQFIYLMCRTYRDCVRLIREQ